jgi:hypothetical protein
VGGNGDGGHEVLPKGGVGDRDQPRAEAARLFAECGQVPGRHGPAAHAAALGPAPVDAVGQHGVGPVGPVGAVAVGRTGRAGQDLDGGEMTEVFGIGQPMHVYRQGEGGERDLQVVQGGAAAQQEVASVRVAARWRFRSACSSMLPKVIRHRHGQYGRTPTRAGPGRTRHRGNAPLWVPKTLHTSCDLLILAE